MPRTKVPKNSKRNRDARDLEKNERLREFDSIFASILGRMNSSHVNGLKELEDEINVTKKKIPKKMLSMPIHEFMKMNINTYEEFSSNSSTFCKSFSVLGKSSSTTSKLSTATSKKSHDEGYLTEDTTSNRVSQNLVPTAQLLIGRTPEKSKIDGRTPGPLSSARAKQRVQRSQSANGYIVNPLLKGMSTTMDHNSRTRQRTPLLGARPKAASADRCLITPKISSLNSPPAVYRWAKPGEMVVSLSGSPVVAQSAPESVANVNIPIKNGILSLRPKKLAEYDNNLVDQLDAKTIQQIKQLQSNLDFILRSKK